MFRSRGDRMRERPALTVRMFLDVKRGPGDTTAAAELVRRFGHEVATRQWPPGRRQPELDFYTRSPDAPAPRKVALHAKCVVVDEREVFVSSANFTEAARERDIEVGLLVKSGSLARRVTCHFESLLAAGHLAAVR